MQDIAQKGDKMKPRLIKWAEDGYPPNDLNADTKDIRELVRAHQTLKKMYADTIKAYEMSDANLSKERRMVARLQDLNRENMDYKSKYYTLLRKRNNFLPTNIMLVIVIAITLYIAFG